MSYYQEQDTDPFEYGWKTCEDRDKPKPCGCNESNGPPLMSGPGFAAGPFAAAPGESEPSLLDMLKTVNPGYQLNAENNIAIAAVIGSDGKATVNAKGNSSYLIGDNERRLFGLNDSALKAAIAKHKGKAPDNAFLKGPTPGVGGYTNLYDQFGWKETTVHLTVKECRVRDIQVTSPVIFSNIWENKSNDAAVYTAELSQKVTNTLSTTTSFSAALSVSSNAKIGIEGLFEIGTGYSFTTTVGKSEEKSQTAEVSASSSVSKTVGPWKSVGVEMSATKRIVKIEVVYEAFLSGSTAYHYSNKYLDHYYYSSPISSVMNTGGIKNSIVFTDQMEIGFYSDARVTVRDL
ncbi:MAG: hypothetical protein FWD03_01100 [Defluviitaleaceae bacterium]|nr:hypothetical protein [Defluviitaleaceae bacterium]